ncbi:MAG: hypothetical protein P4L50_03650 [Anaerolineaceae bacterium]|nr:hypothetical protein [Anaerolineaceae bacterium]
MTPTQISKIKRNPNVSPPPEQEKDIQPWEPIDDELWVPYRVRGSWRGGVLG